MSGDAMTLGDANSRLISYSRARGNYQENRVTLASPVTRSLECTGSLPRASAGARNLSAKVMPPGGNRGLGPCALDIVFQAQIG